MFPSSGMGQGTPTLGVALSNRPNRVGAPFPTPGDGNISCFKNVVF